MVKNRFQILWNVLTQKKVLCKHLIFIDFHHTLNLQLRVCFNRCEDFDPKKTTAVLICSSGTTDMPKLVAHSHYSVFFTLYLTRKHMTESERKESIFITFSPLYWISGTVNMMSSCLLAFTRVQSTRSFSPKDFHNACELYKVSS